MFLSLQMWRQKHAAVCTYLIISSAQELKISPACYSCSIIIKAQIGSEWVSSLGIFSIVHVNRFTASSSAVSLNILQFSQSSRVHVWTTALTLMNIQAQSDCFSQGIFTHVHWLATYHTLHRQLTAHLSKVAKELLISLQAHISLTEKMRCLRSFCQLFQLLQSTSHC